MPKELSLLAPKIDWPPRVEPPALESIVTVDPKLGSVLIPKLAPEVEGRDAKGEEAAVSPPTAENGDAAAPCLGVAKLANGEAVVAVLALNGFGLL